jgi:uncharacterized ion transporter superfamily protein YfcC
LKDRLICESNKFKSVDFNTFKRMKIKSFPNALTFVVGFILFAGVLTYIIPKGKYDRVFDETAQREVVVPGSYRPVEAQNLSPFQVLTCIPRGIINGSEVVVLIFLVGGCFYIVDKTGALKEGVTFLSSKVQGREELALLLIGFLFAIGGATEGLQEEIIPLIPILLTLTKSLGYPPIVTIAISYGAATIGAAFSPVNPFAAVIAQKVAEVPFLSNGLFMLLVSVFAFSLWMFMVIRYGNANRIEKHHSDEVLQATLQPSHVIILSLVGTGFVLLIVGMLFWGWGFNEISATFFCVGVLSGLIGNLGINGTFSSYGEGFKDISVAALIVGLAYGISLLQYVPPALSAFGMMISQAMLHVAVPSYSGQAVLTIPILAPLSDLIGLSREVCVMAFQFGAVLMDMVIPTNGALMAVIALAGISYSEWINFLTKRLVAIYIFCTLVLLLAIALL